MTLHVIREGHLQTPPGFTLNLDRPDFLGDEPFMGVEKGSVEIRPQRLTHEVSHMDVVPRRFSLLSSKRFHRIIARFDERSVPQRRWFLILSDDPSMRNLKFLVGNAVTDGDINSVAQHLAKELHRRFMLPGPCDYGCFRRDIKQSDRT